MTVKELIEALAAYDPEQEVCYLDQGHAASIVGLEHSTAERYDKCETEPTKPIVVLM